MPWRKEPIDRCFEVKYNVGDSSVMKCRVRAFQLRLVRIQKVRNEIYTFDPRIQIILVFLSPLWRNVMESTVNLAVVVRSKKLELPCRFLHFYFFVNLC